MMFSSVNDLFQKINFINSETDPVVEIKITNKWYPIGASVSKFKTMMGAWIMEFQPYGYIESLQYGPRIILGEWSFEDKSGTAVKKSFNDLFKDQNVRLASPESVAAAKALNNKLIAFNAQTNKVLDATGIGLMLHNYFGWTDVNVGWKNSPSPVIVEPLLENRNAGRDYDTTGWRLPFVRVFSLKHKAYVYVDVEELETHVFHKEGKNKIILPQKMLTALDSIFTAKQENIFGDIFHGRHGGIVVLANGPSGVGKTLTAEVFAEYQERPLYSMEMGEIGTSLKDVEANLDKIFARAKKWNAVLLFDEADIFLSERVASDLERSAIVGIFLRLLDYYEGTFFLTTNRGEGIDNAFKSRVTLYLDYPELSPEIRQKIWNNMLQSAAIEVAVDGTTTWTDISLTKLNGRQIRNQVRLLKLMYPDGPVTTTDVMESLSFAAK